MEQKPLPINLYKKNQKSLLDKLIQWTLTIGRVVVIIVEAIALMAFFYRFSLDRQLNDLNQQIVNKQGYVKNFAAEEKKYRDLQDRLTTIGKISTTATQTPQLLEKVVTLLPTGNEFIVSSLAISTESIKIEANTRSITALASFIALLKQQPEFESISIDQLENKTSSATIGVTISASIKGAKKT